MQSPKITVSGTTLTIKVNLAGPQQESKSGKSNLISSYSEKLSNGTVVAGNVFVPIPKAERK
jgi:hypothetical protein